MQIVLSEKARTDLLGIYRYLAERNPVAAETFARRIDENFENLARFPFIGRERSSLAAGLHCLIVGLHLIFYIVEADRIIVVRVIDGRMDVDEEFQR
jgi:toxin ParE1/3/4